MVAVLRKDIMRLMMTERIMPRVWMHRRSMRQFSRWERAMHGTEEASKIWVGGSVNFRILTLVRRTHALTTGNRSFAVSQSWRQTYQKHLKFELNPVDQGKSFELYWWTVTLITVHWQWGCYIHRALPFLTSRVGAYFAGASKPLAWYALSS